ncbi:KN motif and ankyrin repeat domain-containing protein 1 [Liparis tanakae]|uniref:KN motif and ankyrin repeat domain-containing protein 1 n=1 Tax=Liparis tanakae TaxID=230148 RepID=A0A4Z2G588_9TELE|nr:KN motif and ankyrin repeat domain-containing protein 1 [Liparis tanakae]
MAQTMQVNGNAPERGQRCTEDEKAPYYVETPYGYQLDLDFLKYVDDIERGNAVKKLSIQRKPKVAKPSLSAAAPRGIAGGVGGVRAEWTSTDSLSSSNSDDKQSPVFFGARAQLAPGEAHQPLLPPPSPRFAPRRNPQVEKTLMETRLRLEQERLLLAQPHGEPPPRRRLASFGGGSSSSLSSYSGSHHPLPANGHPPNGEYNPYYPPSVGSSIRHSPLSSGMATPVTNVSPLHLQQIREQMVVALKKLKELEEQVKSIPILQVKIAVLQEEKRQLAAQSKNPIPGGGFRKRSFSVGSADQMENPGNPVQKETELHIMEPDAQEQSAQRLDEFRRLAAGVQALETTMAAPTPTAPAETRPRELAQNRPHQRSVGVVTDENMSSLLPVKRAPVLRDAGVSTEPRETRSAAVGVTEAMLGVSGEAEREMELQQQNTEALKEKIYRLEVQLKEAAHQIEMGKLKLELQAAGGASRKKVDKGSTARPEVYSVGVGAKVQTRSLGVGDAAETRSVGAGPEVPMDRWVVRQRVEVHDRCVGRRVETRDQPAATERSALREVGVNTEESVHGRALCRPMAELSRESRSVGCGDAPVEEVAVVKATLSRGTGPDYVGRADAGVTAAPESASTETNTETAVASKSTNTETAVLTDSFTDSGLTTCERHTNTAATETRTVAAGDGLVKDVHAAANTRSVGTATGAESFGGKSSCARTKECGVGPVSVQENFLVGLKTRNMACGPSKPEECGAVEVVEIAAPLQARAQAGGAGLDHYIERVQKLLQEQQMLLAENYSELADAFGQPQSQFGSINSQLVSTLSSINSVMKHGSAEDVRMPQPGGVNEGEENGRQLGAEQSPPVKPPCGPTAAEEAAAATPPQLSAAEQKSRMVLQMSTALHGQPSSLKSIMKKKDGRPDSNSTKKNLQFVGVNGGYETTSSDDSSSEDSSSSGSDDEDDDEEEKEFGGNKEEYKNVEAEEVARKEEEEEEDSEKQEMRERCELSEKMLAASNVLKTHLSDPKAVSGKDLRAGVNTVQHEWFRVSSQKAAEAAMVEDYLGALGAVSPAVLRHVVNMADGNGNTALHYSNKAGYTPIMLAALAAVESPRDMRIVEELFSKGDVNARASQAGQTGLMLAVSHGRMDMVRALLAHGADVNVQDDEGSTALMCASEHGHAEIVKLLLAQPGCDATLSDGDESNALSIALEAGHKDIAVLLYAHVNFSKAQSPQKNVTRFHQEEHVRLEAPPSHPQTPRCYWLTLNEGLDPAHPPTNEIPGNIYMHLMSPKCPFEYDMETNPPAC